MSPALTVLSKTPEVVDVMSSNDFFDSLVSADVPAANPVDELSDLSCDNVEKKFIVKLKSA